MGCTVREKHIRTTRRPRPVKNETDHASAFDRTSLPKPIFDAGVKPLGYHVGVHDSGQNPNLNPNFDDSGWGYCTEEQLEEILLKNLEFLYSEAISKIVALGYDDDVALKAVLRNGNWYGSMDMLTNILHNSLTYLNSNCGGGSSNENSDEAEPFFSDLKQLEQYSLASMVSLLQQMRPNLSKGDAMWCLLMCDLHVGKATSIEIPVLPLPTTTTTTTNNNNNNGCGGTVNSNANVESVNSSTSVGVAVPPLCKFHGGWGFGNGPGSEFPANGIFQCSTDSTLQRDIECPKRFNLSPSMKSLLKRNVAMFAAGFRASSKQLQAQSQACPSSVSSVDATAGIVTGPEVPAEQYEDPNNSKNLDMVNTMLSKFREMNLDENLEFVAEDQKDEMVLTLIHQIKDLDRQVKERREWAHQKAMQAARKLSNDLTELKMLRMEMEDTQQLKKGKQTLEDTTMKKLSEMENALRKASGQVDRANAAVRRLEIENAEIRAEMEASKLSASESVTTCLEVAKREKKCLKRLLAWEKQKAKLQEEIGEEKRKVVDLQQQLIQVEQAQKESEVKWRQDLKAKELAFLQLEEERRGKEAAESNNKRKLESLRLKIEIDFQRHKDDIQRLEQEFTRLKASAQSTELVHPMTTSPIRDHEGGMPQGETIAKLLHELDKLEDSSEKGVNSDRECIICLKEEVSVVFLPCAHEVICANCNEDYGKKVKPACPCCRAPIEQTIRTFGASS